MNLFPGNIPVILTYPALNSGYLVGNPNFSVSLVVDRIEKLPISFVKTVMAEGILCF